MTRGSLVTPTYFPPFFSVSNISAPTSSNKNFGSTEHPTLKLDAFIPKKHVITIIFNPILLPTTQTKGYKRTNTMALRSPPASKATSMKYRNREEDFNRAFRCCNCSRRFHGERCSIGIHGGSRKCRCCWKMRRGAMIKWWCRWLRFLLLLQRQWLNDEVLVTAWWTARRIRDGCCRRDEVRSCDFFFLKKY